jgi:hypothetical protein
MVGKTEVNFSLTQISLVAQNVILQCYPYTCRQLTKPYHLSLSLSLSLSILLTLTIINYNNYIIYYIFYYNDCLIIAIISNLFN